MIAAFIQKRGVTVCPAPFTPEMRELNLKRQQFHEQQSVKGWRGNRRKWMAL